MPTKNKTTEPVKKTERRIFYIARVCHQANKSWCEANGDDSQKDWIAAEEWQRESAINDVRFRLENPDLPFEFTHDKWMEEKVKGGWVYGETKDAEKKTHPALLPFEELSEFEQKKDKLFCVIVDALK